MDKKEIFSMIRRNGHEREKAIRYISDFLQISKNKATIIYENEYIKEYIVQNERECQKNKTGEEKTKTAYKNAFTQMNSTREILEAFRRLQDES